ncbi:hypothetical protein P4H66_16890 [Paenibacillus dokdonensis]|uniref:Uncharacterized protein n=1 Tax=Paenibacillus dokdonensis TaxID=2567944 RepID=A0ABU6GQT9_9BACL|nr:hypothetical protein [Paenibacillus dokdonensis]
MNPLTNGIYVANNANSTISVIDGNTITVITAIPVGSGPNSVGVNP